MAMNFVDNFIQEDIFADILPPVPLKIAKESARSLEKREREELIAKLPEFRVIRSTRRKRSISAYRQNGVIEIHIPDKLTRREEFEAIPKMIAMVHEREKRERKSDSVLAEHSLKILADLLPDFHERANSITWRSMRERWGSCTTVDRTIRISERLANAPEYVIRYVLFHELIHLRIPGHGPDFEAYLARDPEKERAEAFLEGYEAGAAGFSGEILDLPEILESSAGQR